MVIKIEIKLTKTKENRNTATTSVIETGEKNLPFIHDLVIVGISCRCCTAQQEKTVSASTAAWMSLPMRFDQLFVNNCHVVTLLQNQEKSRNQLKSENTYH